MFFNHILAQVMKIYWRVLSFILCGMLFAGTSWSQNTSVDRRPAVSGQFYPSQKDELSRTLHALFSKAVRHKDLKNVLAIISPHAGYQYSGEVAASSFNQIDPAKDYEHIFILGPSHHVGFEGAAIYDKGNFVTPLGVVNVSRDLARELKRKHSVFVDRDDAHTDEHSIEVQLPFLQHIMKRDFRIVPIVIGASTPEISARIADALRPYFNPRNLFVISTDFSHYPSYSDALEVDGATAQAILSNSVATLKRTIDSTAERGIRNLVTSMCGWSCVFTLLSMTQGNPQISMDVIQYKNSGDSRAGGKERVVGYYAIAVAQKARDAKTGFRLQEEDKRELLRIARTTVEQYVRKRQVPFVDTTGFSPLLKAQCGAFVTLEERNSLRGCIGRLDPGEPLYSVVQRMAIAAASEDYRFPPVDPGELEDLDIEISVLTPMQRITSLDEIDLGRHGIYMRKGNRSGTFLPQVARQTGWSKEEFVGHCAQDKAGIGWNGWKDAELFVFEALVFSEKEIAGS
jgi:MEMO1 family protein